MSTASNIHKEVLDAWNRRDFQVMRNLYHAQYTYTGGDGKEIRGPDAGVDVARMYANAFPDGKVEIRNVFVQGDTAVCEFRAHGTHKGEFLGIRPTGKRIEINVCNVIELREGKIYREREYMDTATMLTQLGVNQIPAAMAHA